MHGSQGQTLAHIRQSSPDSGIGVQAKVRKTFEVVPSALHFDKATLTLTGVSLGRGRRTRRTCQPTPPSSALTPGTSQTVKASFWPWLSGKIPLNGVPSSLRFEGVPSSLHFDKATLNLTGVSLGRGRRTGRTCRPTLPSSALTAFLRSASTTQAQNPKPYTPNPRRQTLNPKPQTPNPTP